MPVPVLDTVLDVAGSVLDRVLPDPEAKAAAKRKLMELAQAGQLERERQAIERLRIAASDRDSARRREINVKDWTPRILAFATFVGFFLVLGALLFLEVPEASRQAFLILLGSLQTILAGVVGYYFGSSEGSADKQKTLEALLGRDQKTLEALVAREAPLRGVAPALIGDQRARRAEAQSAPGAGAPDEAPTLIGDQRWRVSLPPELIPSPAMPSPPESPSAGRGGSDAREDGPG